MSKTIHVRKSPIRNYNYAVKISTAFQPNNYDRMQFSEEGYEHMKSIWKEAGYEIIEETSY